MTAKERRRLAELRSYNRATKTAENIIGSKLRRLFASSARKAEEAFLIGGRGAALRSVEGFEDGLAKILMPHYRRVYTIFGNRFFDDLKAADQFETKDQNNVLDEFEIRTRFYMSSIGGRQIQSISQSTRSSIMKAVAAGEANGEGVSAIARRIREKVGGKIGKARANTIARTETHSAANSATFDAAGASGLEGIFEWMSNRGLRTRSTHRRADGQKRKEGNRFKVGGSQLRFPGDPLGPAREIINCRCSVAFRPGKHDEAEGQDAETPEPKLEGLVELQERLLNEYGVAVIDPTFMIGKKAFGKRHTKKNLKSVLDVVEGELVRLKEAGYPDIAKNSTIATLSSKKGTLGQAIGAYHGGYFRRGLPRLIALKADVSKRDMDRTDKSVNMHGQPWVVKTKDKKGSFIGTTFRHELGHTLTSPLVLSRFREIAGRLMLKDFRINNDFKVFTTAEQTDLALEWFTRNLSTYGAHNLHESVAEAFARYTAGNYVKGELPKEIEELLEIMAKGKLPDRDAGGKIIGRDPQVENNFSDFAKSMPTAIPKPGQRVKSQPEEFDADGNYLGGPYVEKDDVEFIDEPEVSLGDRLREKYGDK